MSAQDESNSSPASEPPQSPPITFDDRDRAVLFNVLNGILAERARDDSQVVEAQGDDTAAADDDDMEAGSDNGGGEDEDMADADDTDNNDDDDDDDDTTDDTDDDAMDISSDSGVAVDTDVVMETTTDVWIPSSPPSFKERLSHLPRHEEVMWHRIRAYFTAYSTASSVPYALCYVCQDAELKIGWLPPADALNYTSMPLKPAVYFACGHMVCRECAAGLYSTQEFLRCPACRHALHHSLCGHNAQGQDMSAPEGSILSHTAWFQKTLDFRTKTIPEGGSIPDLCVPCRLRAARVGSKRRAVVMLRALPELMGDAQTEEDKRERKKALIDMLVKYSTHRLRYQVAEELPVWGTDWHRGLGEFDEEAPFPWDAWTSASAERKVRIIRRFWATLNAGPAEEAAEAEEEDEEDEGQMDEQMDEGMDGEMDVEVDVEIESDQGSS
ncbi:hypothetical protein B0T19DRAFT_401608 [Cercophora scortea]|uniref:RING-type domain-containing protein n=1 Tax=Cercophora scortea TaxID=314031 RepID=A0AAE0IDZ4_9PEZI|nr:hypothetical protein B0T19DRAFT_401608 [Cercophora scortea]